MRVLRSVAHMRASKQNEVNYRDAHVLVWLGMPPFEQHLRLLRCMSFLRVLRYAPATLVRLVFSLRESAGSWTQLIAQDLAMLRDHLCAVDGVAQKRKCVPILQQMPCPLLDIVAWANDMVTRPMFWKRVFKQWFRSVCIGEIPIGIPATEPPIPPPTSDFYCPDCDSSFPTKSQLYTHRAKKHNYRNPMKSRIATSLCLCCST